MTALSTAQCMHASQATCASLQMIDKESAAGTLPSLARQRKADHVLRGTRCTSWRMLGHWLRIRSGMQHHRRRRQQNALQVQVRESRGAKPEDLQAGAGSQRQVRHGCHMQLNRLQAVAVLHLQWTQANHQRPYPQTRHNPQGPQRKEPLTST